MLFFFISRESSSPKRYENMFEKMLLYIVECSMLCIKKYIFLISLLVFYDKCTSGS